MDKYAQQVGYKPPKLANPGNLIHTIEDPEINMNFGHVIHVKVGGGHMGHELAHENEAPFPLELAEFFVKSFVPPGGTVLDPFCGSGTTAHAAHLHGRNSIMTDIRESQILLTGRRMATTGCTIEAEMKNAA